MKTKSRQVNALLIPQQDRNGAYYGFEGLPFLLLDDKIKNMHLYPLPWEAALTAISWTVFIPLYSPTSEIEDCVLMLKESWDIMVYKLSINVADQANRLNLSILHRHDGLSFILLLSHNAASWPYSPAWKHYSTSTINCNSLPNIHFKCSP